MFENQIYVIAKLIFNFNILWLELGISFVFYRTTKKKMKKKRVKKKKRQKPKYKQIICFVIYQNILF